MKGRKIRAIPPVPGEQNVSSGAAFLWTAGSLLVLSWLRMPAFLGAAMAAVVLAGGILLHVRSAGNPPGRIFPLSMDEFLPRPSRAFWAALVLLILVTRFYRYDSLNHWPNYDEAQIAYCAQRLNETWEWRMFWGFGEAPTTMCWLVACASRFLEDPLAAVWLPPAFISTLTVVVAYPVARQYLSRSLSLVVTLLFAITFWPLNMGRICHQGVPLPLWMILFIYVAGKYRNDSGSPIRGYWAALSGILAGAGPFTFTPWPAVAIVAVGTFFSMSRRRWGDRVLFAAAFALAMTPFLLDVASRGWGLHIHAVAAWNGWLPSREVILASVSYITGIYTYPVQTDDCYGAWRGGLLNPILGALSLGGWVVLWRRRHESVGQWCLFVFPVLLAPGLLSMNVEFFRIAQVMPVLMLTIALGAANLLRSFPEGRQRILIGLTILAFSAAWDVDLILRPSLTFPRDPRLFLRDMRSADSWALYQLLSDQARVKGPGWILDFSTHRRTDVSLEVGVYRLNAAGNPSLTPAQARWVAIIADADHGTYLARRFPEGTWRTTKGPWPTGKARTVGLMPLTIGNRPVLERWRTALEGLEKANRVFLYLPSGAPYDEVFKVLDGIRENFRRDPFLESVLWEWRGEYQYELTRHLDLHLAELEEALRWGYPAPQVLFKYGILLMRQGRFEEAGHILRRASEIKPDDPTIKEALQHLSRIGHDDAKP